MTIPRLEELTHYWRQSPPIHLLVKQMFAEPAATTPTEADLAMFVNSFKGA